MTVAKLVGPDTNHLAHMTRGRHCLMKAVIESGYFRAKNEEFFTGHKAFPEG